MVQYGVIERNKKNILIC